MPLEQTTTRLQSITSKSGTKKDGEPWVRYDFQLDGFKRPWSTFDATLFNPALQGKMVRASGSTEERTFTGDTGSPITYTQYTLRNIELVEGESGSLDEVLAPIAARETATQFTNGGPASPSQAAEDFMRRKHPDEQAAIARAVALDKAAMVASAMLQAGLEVNTEYITQLAAKFEPYLNG